MTIVTGRTVVADFGHHVASGTASSGSSTFNARGTTLEKISNRRVGINGADVASLSARCRVPSRRPIVRGHEKVPACGRFEVLAGGQVKVPGPSFVVSFGSSWPGW